VSKSRLKPFKRISNDGRFGRPLVTTAEISKRMATIRRSGTRPELVVRDVARDLAIRFSINNDDLEGSPDLANRRRKFAVFVHGCFWHRHANCNKSTTPKSNVAFWEEKFARNQARDRAAFGALRRRGYRPLVIWECQTKDRRAMSRRIAAWLESASASQ
jgi:DNA mismatch endonuclease (patch repair protein)